MPTRAPRNRFRRVPGRRGHEDWMRDMATQSSGHGTLGLITKARFNKSVTQDIVHGAYPTTLMRGATPTSEASKASPLLPGSRVQEMRTRRFIARLILGAAVFVAVDICPSSAQQATYPPTASLEEIQHRIRDISASSSDHPRLLATQKDLDQLADSSEQDPLRRQVADLVVRQADMLRDEEPIQRKLVGRRLLGESRRCVQRVLTLAMAYHLTGDARHAERCRQEMLAAARFRDWNPSHFLDVAEMTFALAIGYDWLYDELDEASRGEIRSAIVQKGVALPFETRHNNWVRAKNNWGQVCHGGLTAGALAVLEHEPELAARTVHSALQNVVASMAAYAPRGSYPEGPGYWHYGTSYNVLLVGVLESALRTDFGLSQAPGFDQTGAYPALACGPSGLFFNYADGRAERSAEPTLFWFASRYRRPDWLHGEREIWQKQAAERRRESFARSSRFFPLALLWMGDSASPSEVRMPLHWFGAGEVPVSVHRSSWSDPRATYVGLKGGSPSASHGQMDTGSFVLDSDGVRWAVDLGSEGYHAIESRKMNLWSRDQDSDRWTIFRQSNHGHNTLVIDDQLQVAAGDAPIVHFSDNPVRPHSIVDLSPVYRGQVDSAWRGVALLPSREVLIQDELTGLRPGSRVRWGMITGGEPAGLGTGVITLRQAGEQLTLTVVTPETIRWKQIDTARPRNEWDSPNPDTRMVTFEATAPDSGILTLTVVATPGTCSEPVASDLPVVPLKSWSRRP